MDKYIHKYIIYYIYIIIYIHTYVHTYVCTYICTYIPEVLISSYGAPLAQRASYLALHSSLFGPDGAVNYDYIVSLSLTALTLC